LLEALGAFSQPAIGQVPQPGPHTRAGRNCTVRAMYKEEFTGRGKLARKAHMGEIDLMGRTRGLQVRRVGDMLRITR